MTDGVDLSAVLDEDPDEASGGRSSGSAGGGGEPGSGGRAGPDGPGEKRVSYAETFFDLVWVLCVTQISGLLHQHHDWAGTGRARAGPCSGPWPGPG